LWASCRNKLRTAWVDCAPGAQCWPTVPAPALAMAVSGPDATIGSASSCSLCGDRADMRPYSALLREPVDSAGERELSKLPAVVPSVDSSHVTLHSRSRSEDSMSDATAAMIVACMSRGGDAACSPPTGHSATAAPPGLLDGVGGWSPAELLCRSALVLSSGVGQLEQGHWRVRQRWQGACKTHEIPDGTNRSHKSLTSPSHFFLSALHCVQAAPRRSRAAFGDSTEPQARSRFCASDNCSKLHSDCTPLNMSTCCKGGFEHAKPFLAQRPHGACSEWFLWKEISRRA